MTKSPFPPQSYAALRKVLERYIPEGWYVDSQEPVTLAESEPEPDAVVMCGNSDDFGERHPGPGDVALVAEVTDSSLPRDRVFKKKFTPRPASPSTGSSTWSIATLKCTRTAPIRRRGPTTPVRPIHRRGQRAASR